MIKNYITIALKVLMRRKFFTAVSLFGISFTLMTLVVASSFLDYSFSAKAPEEKFDRVLWAERYRMRSPDKNSNWSSDGTGYYTVNHYLRKSVEKLGDMVEKYSVFTNSGGGIIYLETEKISFRNRRTDGAYWEIIDFEFLEGRGLSDDDDKNRNNVCVINETLRNRFFKGENAVGKTVLYDGYNYKVVGVVKDVPETRSIAFSDMWLPISSTLNQNYNKIPTANEDLMDGGYQAMYLVKSKAFFDEVKTASQAALNEVIFPDPKEYSFLETRPRTKFESVSANLFFDWEQMLSTEQSHKLMLGIILAYLVFMILPAVNLINLNTSRMMERASEIGVRKAFGAASPTLVTQFIIENVCLTVIGGAIGLILSVFALRMINESGIWKYADFGLNWKVFLIGLFLSLLFGVISGAYPAWKMSRLNVVQALKGIRS
ncbi:MAG: FtsX-like permease family protein [Chloroherpetonaceae bacterium]|nr:FtsX-like permease family protein [Chloroherpetonaceae bacterium]